MDTLKIENAVRDILEAIGEDPDRAALRETPKRVAAMCSELFGGIEDDPRKFLKIFDEKTQDGFICVNDIPVRSVCEHHLLPFIGTCDVVYIADDDKIIGLSKLARIVDCFSRRPQVQERLTNEIADFLSRELSASGVAVRIRAEHLCMTMRGAKASGAYTVTHAFRGVLKSDPVLNSQAAALLKGDR